MASASTASAPRNDFWRRLALMATVGTFVPLAVLALLYVLVPMPLTPAAIAVLRTANHIAGLVVLVNTVMAVALTIGGLLRRSAKATPSQPIAWARPSAA